MPLDANTIQSIHLLERGGRSLIPADSGLGDVGRPRAQGQRGGRIATLETFFDYYINNVPPPDEAKQLDPNIEQKIRMHPDVVAAHEKRTFTVSAMPWRIDPNPKAANKEAAKEIANYCQNAIEDIPNFQDAIEHMQYAVLVGGQGLEFDWHQDADGREFPIGVHPVHMDRFLFDRLGNLALLTRDNAVWGAYVSQNPQQQSNPQYRSAGNLPAGKFIYHVYRQGQGSWYRPALQGYEYYGIGLDVALYYVITFDVFCLKFRMKFLERYGIPPTVLYYPENRTMSRDVSRIADSLRGESIITIPKLMGASGADNVNSLYKVEQLPVPSGSYDFFEGFSDRYTLPRVNAIMLGRGDENHKDQGGKGGYSEDVSRRDAGPNVWFKRDAWKIGATFTKQFLPAVALGRFPNLPPDLWPMFVIEPKEEKDRMQELQIIEAGSKMVPIPEDHVYEQTGLPKPKGGEKTVGGPQPGGDDGMGDMFPPGAPPKLAGQKSGIGQGFGFEAGKGALANAGV